MTEDVLSMGPIPAKEENRIRIAIGEVFVMCYQVSGAGHKTVCRKKCYLYPYTRIGS